MLEFAEVVGAKRFERIHVDGKGFAQHGDKFWLLHLAVWTDSVCTGKHIGNLVEVLVVDASLAVLGSAGLGSGS